MKPSILNFFSTLKSHLQNFHSELSLFLILICVFVLNLLELPLLPALVGVAAFAFGVILAVVIFQDGVDLKETVNSIILCYF